MKKIDYPSITPDSKRSHYPLSFQQERVWFLSQVQRQSPLWNRLSCKRLTGVINIEILKKSVMILREYQSALKSTIHIYNHLPKQVETGACGDIFHTIDLTHLDDAKREMTLRQVLFDENSTVIKIENDPLFFVLLIQLRSDEYALLLKFHHILSDATTIQIIWKDLKHIYNSCCIGKEIDTWRGINYFDYAVWQREVLDGPIIKKQEEYWLDELRGEIPTLNMPKNYHLPDSIGTSGSSEKIVLSKDFYKEVQTFSLKHRVLAYTTCLTAFYILLNWYSQDEDIFFGTAFSGRHYSFDLKDLAGFFVNTVCLRLQSDNNLTISEFVRLVHHKVVNAHLNQDYPFEELVRILKPDRKHKRNPLFQAAFNFITNYQEDSSFKGINREQPIEIQHLTSQVDITLEIQVNPEDIEICFEYSTELFKKKTISRMVAQYVSILRTMVNTPNLRLGELELLEEEEKRQFLFDYQPAKQISCNLKNKSLQLLISDVAAKSPQATAIICGNDQISYRDLEAKANRIARHLQILGADPGKFVGISIDRSIEMIVGILGIIKSGCAYVPLDPDSPPERLSFILKDADLQFILTQDHWDDSIQRIGATILNIDDLLASSPKDNRVIPSFSCDWLNYAYMIYTSGSTGIPKGVKISQKNLLTMLYSFEEVSTKARPLIGTSLCSYGFDVSVWEFFSTLCFGGTLHILQPPVYSNAKRFAQYITEKNITSAYIPPALLLPTIEELETQRDTLFLKRLLTGVEPIPQELMQRYRNISTELQIINAYGPTETTICATCYTFETATQPKNIVPIGKPIPNYCVYLVNQSMQLVPKGISGEILIGGQAVADGYHNRTGLTAQKFLPNPFTLNPGERLYRTGDLARWTENGLLEFNGRVDNQVKIHGFRVELGEIETNLLQHDNVREAVVQVSNSSSGSRQIIAHVVLNAKNDNSPDDLNRYLKNKIPKYMLPAHYFILDVIPRTTNGKIDRAQLPKFDETFLQQNYILPRNSIEIKLSVVLGKVLGIKKIGIYDDFFSLGGHSLLATQAVLMINSELSIDLPLNILLEVPTIADLGDYINTLNELRFVESKHDSEQTTDREVGTI